MNIRERQEKLVEFFNSFGDEMSKYSYLIERGGSLDLIKPEEKDEAHLVDGCQSSVWLLVDTDSNDRLVIRAESDSFVVQGVLSIIIDLFNGRTSQEITDFDFNFFDRVGLSSLFSDERKNGIASLIDSIKDQSQAISRGQKGV